MKIIENFKSTIFWKSLQILPQRDRKRIPLVIFAQVSLGFLDLLGVALFGIVGALAVSGVSTGVPGNRVLSVLKFLHLSHLSFQSQVTFLGLAAAFVLVIKTIISALLVRRITYYLSRRGALMTAELSRRLFFSNSEVVRARTPQENLFALTNGITAISVGILPICISFFADGSLLLILLSGLIAVDAITALATILLFGFTAFVLYKMMHEHARNLGEINAQLTIRNNQTILEGLSSFREIVVRSRRHYYIEKIADQRQGIANAAAGMANMPNLSKYVLEITVVVGAIVMSSIQFLTQDAVHAVGILSVFMTASTRIAPAVLRIQQGSVQIRSHSGSAKPSLTLIEELHANSEITQESQLVDFQHQSFVPQIILQDVSFSYTNSKSLVLKEISLNVQPGEFCAVVGPSGAGKSTLIDVILGILEITEGKIEISGKSPDSAVRNWPGAVSYLPQDIFLSEGSIRTNVAMGYRDEEVSEEYLNRAIEISQLQNVLESLKEGIETKVSERGENFSGGQRQRIGIARALYTNPKLLILDEATSALDADTEATFTKALRTLRGEITVLMVAHRLSTIKDADRIYYLEEGKILGQGTFEELKAIVPDFARQAGLMGL